LRDPGFAGDLSRQFLRYAVSCALDSTQSFSLSWTSAGVVHDETYPGLLGLATSWATRPLSRSGQRWVSACLASRVNWYGIQVVISSRGPRRALTATVSELSTFPMIEGAFFGNVFGPAPAVYSCYYPPNVAHSRSLHRDCATGHDVGDGETVDCGTLEVLGPCDSYCESFDEGEKYYWGCSGTHRPEAGADRRHVAAGEAIREIVTTALR
jgi:hypothetical protein